ncbi:unnamed protein product [Oreochromis niloticus]|nr:unnamed protein product [Mustela putorius furo]
MTTRKESQIAPELSSWCSKAGIDPNRAFVLHDVPTDCDLSDIEETAQSVKVFGRVKVRDRLTDTQTGNNLVLCECRQDIQPDRIPPQVQPLNGGPVWMISLLTQSVRSADDFSTKLKKLMVAEGKTIDDVSALLSTETPQENSPESIIRAVGDLLAKTMRPTSENTASRRLRIFSGQSPTPAGEESLDSWVEQARLMIEECDCSEREKRRRIVESLKGPALEIIQAVRRDNPDASPESYVEALESSFGSLESGEDLYLAFRSLGQQRGEKLSDFLRRLERSLTKVVQRGGLPSHQVDRARIDQLIRGATESEIMLLQLRIRERKEEPPTFLKLLSEIREEEDHARVRHESNTTVRQVKVGEETKAKSTEGSTQTDSTKRDERARRSKVNRPHAAKDSDSYFCYRCGENGHIATRCMAPENTAKVIQRLLAALRRSKEEKGATGCASEPTQVGSIRKSSVHTSSQCGLPDGLVGPSMMSDVTIEGQPCRALLDSGSRVTIIFESWYSRFIPNVPILPLQDLAIWGLSDSNYPYRGYVAVEVGFSPNSKEAVETVTVLALVCPDPKSPDPVPVIIGTNSQKLHSLLRNCEAIGGKDEVHSLRINTLSSQQPSSLITQQTGVVGHVKWQGPGPITTPPCAVQYAVCKVEQQQPLDKSILMVEVGESTNLPAGVLVPPVVLPSSEMDTNSFTLLLRNESQRETIVPTGTVLAQVYLVDTVTELTKTSAQERSIDPELFDFGDSPIPEEWKARSPQVTADGWVDIPLSGVKALCRRITTDGFYQHTTRFVDQLGASPDAIPALYANFTQIEVGPLEQLSLKELSEAQDSDPVIGVVKSQVERNQSVSAPTHANPDVVLLMRDRSKLKVKRGLLYRVTTRPSGREVSQIILPAKYRPMVLKSVHDDAGHLGTERTTELIKDRFYWPRVASEVATYIQNCGRCVARKSIPQKAAPLQHITSNGPLDLVCIDFLSIEPDSKGIANVLVVTDHYARVRNQTLEEGDRVLVRNLGLTGKHKLQDRWNSLPYIVIAKLPNLPVYCVKPERGTGIVRTVHRDHLLPIGYMVRMSAPSEKTVQPKRPRTRAQQVRCENESQTQDLEHLSEDDWSSESEEQCVYYEPPLAFRDSVEPQSEGVEQKEVVSLPDQMENDHPRVHKLSEVEEQGEQLPVAVDQAGESSQQHQDSVVAEELEERDVPAPSVSVGGADSPYDLQTKRRVRPVVRLSYDEPGRPTDRPVTISYRGMVIQICYDPD